MSATACSIPSAARPTDVAPLQVFQTALKPLLALRRWPVEYRLYFLVRLAERLDGAGTDSDAIARAIAPFSRPGTYRSLGHQYATSEPNEILAAVLLEAALSRLAEHATQPWQVTAIARARSHVLAGPLSLAAARVASGGPWDQQMVRYVSLRALETASARSGSATHLALSLVVECALLRVIISSAPAAQAAKAAAEGMVILQGLVGQLARPWATELEPVPQSLILLRF